MKLTIYGRIPSKKNSVVMFVRNGKLFKMPSNQYRVWHADASRQLVRHAGVGRDKVIENAEISIILFAPDRRSADLTNKAESVMDLLVDNGIIKDDNWFVIGKITLTFGGVDKEKPRAEIEITPCEDTK